jgi:hypothetical protein
VVTQVPGQELSPTEQALVECVGRGELLDLLPDGEPADEAAMRSWRDDRVCRAAVIRDILRGRLVADPDPHGLRLRGARIAGRLDLDNLTTALDVVLDDCLLEEGVLARNARMAVVALRGCRLEHPAEPPINAIRLSCSVLDLSRATITGHAERGAVNLLGAHISDQLDCTGATLGNDSGPALVAENLQVGQGMYLRGGFTATGGGELGAVRLLGAHISGQLNCTGATLGNDSGPALAADSLQVGQAMFLRGFTATGSSDRGAVRLLGAHISGQLNCTGATLGNDSGPALHADGLQVGQAMVLSSGFTATGSSDRGAVRLLGAHISGQLDCTGATLGNDSGPALHADGLQVGQDIYLRDGFTATGGGADAAVDLTGTRVGGTLLFDLDGLQHAADSGPLLAVEGLTYAGVPGLASARDWVRLLRHGTPRYAAQPYQQLAAGYQALGDDRQARQILIAQRDDQLTRADTSRLEPLWGRVTRTTLRYGYQPWRALLFLAGVLVLSCVLAVVLGSHGALAQVTGTAVTGRSCTVVQQISVGLDLNLPVGTTLARAGCGLAGNPASATASGLAVAGWLLRVLAWAFAALFIAGFTSAVRKT